MSRTIVAIDILILCVAIATCPLWVERVGLFVEAAWRDLRRLVSRDKL